MSISIYKIKKWYRMLMGKSIMHVNQDLGKSFVVGELKGYHNNLTEKVLRDPLTMEQKTLPSTTDETGKTIVFPVAIFQYGLGAYDLFLQTSEQRYLDQFLLCVKWAEENQLESGAWNNFYFIYPQNPYGAMCQGEGASLLLRAYIQTADPKYLEHAKKAIDFMLLPAESGGATDYQGENVTLLEYTHRSAVLNGWIFALFGLYDISLATDEKRYQKVFEKSWHTLEKQMASFDNGYWSMYDLDGKIASPFYHDLHIAQMEALYMVTGSEVFLEYLQRWKAYRNKKQNKARAFLKKVWQKVRE